MKNNNKISSNDDYLLLRVISFIFPISDNNNNYPSLYNYCNYYPTEYHLSGTRY